MNIIHVPGGSLYTLDTSPSLLYQLQSSEVDLIWFCLTDVETETELLANNHRVGRSEVPTQPLLTPKLILFSLLTYIALPMTLIIFCLIFQVSRYESFGSKCLTYLFLA